MTTVDYKVLFEVRVLHDYYLYGLDPNAPDQGARSFFAMSAGADSQAQRLVDLLRSGGYDVRTVLEFPVGSGERSLFNGLHLRMVTTATGFFVGMEVVALPPNGGPLRFQPAITPSSNTTLTIGVAGADPGFGAITNLRLDRDSPNIYLFTNDGPHDGAALSVPMANLVPGQQYRMGDLALVGGAPQQAQVDNAGDQGPGVWDKGAWDPGPGTGFVNQGDRALAPDVGWFQDWKLTIDRPPSALMGVLRIGLNNGNGALSPIGGDGLLATQLPLGQASPAHPVFELRFLSRATYWRYQKMGGFTAADKAAIQKYAVQTDGTPLLDDNTKTDGTFVTKAPRPLASELPPLVPAVEPPFRIPNAQPGSLAAAGGKVYSEIYFNDVVPV